MAERRDPPGEDPRQKRGPAMADSLSPSGLLAVWVLGASMGLTACTATCLPFMGTWMVARAGGQANPLRDTAGFIGGRIAAYTLLGALAAQAGQELAAFARKKGRQQPSSRCSRGSRSSWRA